MKKVCNVAKDAIDNAEAIIVLSLASIGLSGILMKHVSLNLPIWINPNTFIPVMSVLAIIGIIKLMELRHEKDTIGIM